MTLARSLRALAPAILAACLLPAMLSTARPAQAAITHDDAQPSLEARVAFYNIPGEVILGIARANRQGGIDGRFQSPDLSAYDAYVLFAEPDQLLEELPYGQLLDLAQETLATGVTKVTRSGLPPVLIFETGLLDDGYDPNCVGRLIHRSVVGAVRQGQMALPRLFSCDSAVLGGLAR